MAMGRPAGALNQANRQFFERFDKYCQNYIDPLELLFQVAAKSRKAGTGWETGHRMTAAQTLMQYRYPRLKALEISDGTNTPAIQISWLDLDGEVLQPPPDMLDQPDLLN
jgi:hypothetical protein